MLSLFAAALVHAVTIVDRAPVHTLTVPAGSVVTPVSTNPGRTVSGYAAVNAARGAINGGYFNHSDGWPVSHTIAAGRPLGMPEENRALTGNPVLKPHLPTILNVRSAWFQGDGGWAIAPWNAGPTGFTDALQAGPALLPAPRLDAEAFVVRDAKGRVVRDGIGSSARAARSALGLKADGTMVWAVAGMPGLTIAGLAQAMKGFGCTSALALDGGSSSALVWTENGKRRTFVGTGRGEARVRSVLLVR